MTMIGGLGTTGGPIIGAVALTLLSNWLRYLEDFLKMDIRLVIYGLMLILTIRFMCEGLEGVIGGLSDRIRQAGQGKEGGNAS